MRNRIFFASDPPRYPECLFAIACETMLAGMKVSINGTENILNTRNTELKTEGGQMHSRGCATPSIGLVGVAHPLLFL